MSLSGALCRFSKPVPVSPAVIAVNCRKIVLKKLNGNIGVVHENVAQQSSIPVPVRSFGHKHDSFSFSKIAEEVSSLIIAFVAFLRRVYANEAHVLAAA